MIHINRSADKKFYVTVVAENGEILSTSETLNSKQAAWKNIRAQHKQYVAAKYPHYGVLVTDNTLQNPKSKIYIN